MKDEKYLGKIYSATFGLGGGGADDRLGMTLNFQFDGISRVETFIENSGLIKNTLVEAKKTNIAQLVNVPVEVHIRDNALYDWRILVEVL